jgi:hypothetical protein
MEKKAVPAATARRFAEIGEALAGRGVVVSQMFGMPCLKVGGKAFAGVFGAAMVFKLGGDAHAEALKLKDAELFDPSGMGRAMKKWVVVPSAHARRWADLAGNACTAATATESGAADAEF